MKNQSSYTRLSLLGSRQTALVFPGPLLAGGGGGGAGLVLAAGLGLGGGGTTGGLCGTGAPILTESL